MVFSALIHWVEAFSLHLISFMRFFMRFRLVVYLPQRLGSFNSSTRIFSAALTPMGTDACLFFCDFIDLFAEFLEVGLLLV